MRRLTALCAQVMTFVMASSLAVYALPAGQNPIAGGPQQFVVLQSEALTVPFESLSSEQAQCSISGNGSFASLRCQAPPGTAKALYHYVAMLVVDQQGMAYGIACHQTLVDLWCKKMSPGVAIQGSFDGARKSLSIADGQKFHSYQTLTSAFVGPLQSGQPGSPGKHPKAAPATATTTPAPAGQPTTSTPQAGQGATASPAQTNPGAAVTDDNASSSAFGTCRSAAVSCAAFASEPSGADIYVDGKFVGSTPSTLALSPGSHQIRIEADAFKSWTRTLESTAGSTVTVHATLVKQ